MRLGKREREAAKDRQIVIEANLARMSQIKAEAHYGAIRSSADPSRLREATHTGYRDNLHGRYRAPPTSGSCRVDRKQ